MKDLEPLFADLDPRSNESSHPRCIVFRTRFLQHITQVVHMLSHFLGDVIKLDPGSWIVLMGTTYWRSYVIKNEEGKQAKRITLVPFFPGWPAITYVQKELPFYHINIPATVMSR